ncbi:hypothetical protein [Chitinophaga sp. 212800010-3]|uniref:hypothetical protein n=1 Tax=unclassified Chitinophaga TaxID=2619133 RepID=UPI002DF71D5D|nr:hypothetical protein [Chitinophaga sp. 212800010-3]
MINRKFFAVVLAMAITYTSVAGASVQQPQQGKPKKDTSWKPGSKKGGELHQPPVKSKKDSTSKPRKKQ